MRVWCLVLDTIHPSCCSLLVTHDQQGEERKSRLITATSVPKLDTRFRHFDFSSRRESGSTGFGLDWPVGCSRLFVIVLPQKDQEMSTEIFDLAATAVPGTSMTVVAETDPATLPEGCMKLVLEYLLDMNDFDPKHWDPMFSYEVYGEDVEEAFLDPEDWLIPEAMSAKAVQRFFLHFSGVSKRWREIVGSLIKTPAFSFDLYYLFPDGGSDERFHGELEAYDWAMEMHICIRSIEITCHHFIFRHSPTLIRLLMDCNTNYVAEARICFHGDTVDRYFSFYEFPTEELRRLEVKRRLKKIDHWQRLTRAFQGILVMECPNLHSIHLELWEESLTKRIQSFASTGTHREDSPVLFERDTIHNVSISCVYGSDVLEYYPHRLNDCIDTNLIDNIIQGWSNLDRLVLRCDHFYGEKGTIFEREQTFNITSQSLRILDVTHWNAHSAVIVALRCPNLRHLYCGSPIPHWTKTMHQLANVPVACKVKRLEQKHVVFSMLKLDHPMESDESLMRRSQFYVAREDYGIPSLTKERDENLDYIYAWEIRYAVALGEIIRALRWDEIAETGIQNGNKYKEKCFEVEL
jgi:hypothetical protein